LSALVSRQTALKDRRAIDGWLLRYVAAEVFLSVQLGLQAVVISTLVAIDRAGFVHTTRRIRRLTHAHLQGCERLCCNPSSRHQLIPDTEPAEIELSCAAYPAASPV